MLWIVLISLGVVAAWLLVLPALKAKPVVDESREALNVKIFQQRLAELEGDKQAQRIDEDEYHGLKVELERNFLSDMSHADLKTQISGGKTRWAMLLMILFVPVASLLVYKTTGYQPVFSAWVKTQQQLDPLLDQMLEGTLKPEAMQAVPMQDYVYGLQRRAQYDADNAQLWFALGNTYLQLQSKDVNEQARLYDSAVKSLRRAYYLQPEHSGYALAYAQVLINQNQGKLDLESRKIILGVLKIQPDFPAAVMMLAMASYQSGDYQAAIDGWQKLLKMGEGNASYNQVEPILKKSIARAKKQLAAVSNVETAVVAMPDSTKLADLKITVSIAEDAEPDLDKGYLMVYAQAEKGPAMPLAVKKLPLPIRFPKQVTLSDADAMMDTMKISQFEQVKITARISLSGTANQSAGDWVGFLRGVNTRSRQGSLHILIDQQTP
ncbi:MAG: c-type cytochrome biogenesis protein CcmI [Gammaproteobacteria bacterium]|nr:MAG: c-type cytochrome biogenesis protein CcmI [Gammaproteobacteria bacterium]